MNKTKLITTSAIATVMTATSAYADLSISGGMAGWWYTADNANSVSRTWNTESVNVSYSSTLDNGMGISVGANVGGTAHSTSTNNTSYTATISSDMGSISFGDQIASAADKADGVNGLSLFECCTWGSTVPDGMSAGYDDGDGSQGNEGFLYVSPSISGWTVYLSHGLTAGAASENATDTNGAAIKGSVGPVTVSAGLNSVGDNGTAGTGYDSTFGQAAMDLGPMNVSVGMMNGGSARTDSNAIAVTMPILGMTTRAAIVDSDADGAAYDQSGYQIGMAKSMGAATFGVQYDNADTAAGDAGEIETWKLTYAIYF
jgi:hypothetical protein